MDLNAAYLRERAQHLRQLAEAARDRPTMKYLIQLAEDFEEEALKLDKAVTERRA